MSKKVLLAGESWMSYTMLRDLIHFTLLPMKPVKNG